MQPLPNPPANGGANILDDKLRLAEMSKSTISVSQSGTGNFKTIKEAIASIPSYNTQRVLINIGPGVYREKIKIPKHMDFITFLGDASDPPTITGHDSAGKSSKTFESATVGADADYFMAVNVKFENTHPHVDSSEGDQAVALRISGTKASFYNCGFYGSQDTLYDHKGLHYFKNCFIQGSVDFIFGYGRSLYENCELKSIANNTGSLTAQKREKTSSMESGFSFKDCKVSGSGQVYLGRAWGDYSRVIFSYTFLDKIILPQGWHNWGIPRREKTVYYGEYKCSGPGSNMSGRVSWARALTDEEAQPFLGTYFVDGDTWLNTSP